MDKIIILLFLCLLPAKALSQDLPESFLQDYQQGVSFTHQHSQLIKEVCQHYGHDPAVIFSIAFPELTRYHQFRDQLEIVLNHIDQSMNWQQLDFSVGPLQMKPSFAREILKLVKNHSWLATRYDTLLKLPVHEAEFVHTISKLNWQMHLLNAFYDICQNRWPVASAEEHLLLMATAYNAGLYHSKDRLLQLAREEAFPFGNFIRSQQVSYGYWALQFYRHDAQLLNH